MPVRRTLRAPAAGSGQVSTTDLFADVVGQDLAVSILRRALAQGPSHAYLFAGPSGVGKGDAALAFASALVCDRGGCGGCDTCRRVRRGLHPDVQAVGPEGTFILVDQIRELNHDVALRPYEASSKVYVVYEAETMNQEAANAFLRTLEEPPGHAHFLLVTNMVHRILPTIASRCQVVPFSRTPASLIATHLIEAYGLDESDAFVFSRVAQGNLAYAQRLACSLDARAQRIRLLAWARDAPSSSYLAVERMLDEMFMALEAHAQARTEPLKSRKQEGLEWAADARSRTWVEKEADKRIKREHKRGIDEGLEEVTTVFQSWYRDLCLAAVGAEDAILNLDHLAELRHDAEPARRAAYRTVMQVTRRAQERLRYNVDARCAINDMLAGIKEALS